MTEQDMKDLKLAGTGSTEGMFCLQCRDCQDQCPQHVDIPTLMRSYLYAYGYRTMHHARQTFDMANFSVMECNKCDECSVNCKAGFNIKNKVHDIARLQTIPEDFLV